jgi:hypothetical protein
MPSVCNPNRLAVLLACGLALLGAAGCNEKKVHAAAPVSAPPQPTIAEVERPMNVAPDTSALPPGDQPATPPPVSTGSTTAASPPVVTLPKPKPAPPKPSTGQSTTETANEESSRPLPPQITPELSASDQEILKRRTDDDANVAQQNLHQTDGKQLSAAQKDLVEKISSFLAESRDAGKSGDWARAQNLAQKARSLSAELVGTL